MKKIIVTSTTCPSLDISGLEVLHVPLLATVCLEFEIPAFETAVFYSKHGVRCAHAAGVDLTGKAVWSVGDSTAELVANLFATPARTGDMQNFEGLTSAMQREGNHGRIASFELADGPRSLQDVFADVIPIPTYATAQRTEPELAPMLEQADAVLFASPRAVDAFVALTDTRPFAGSIGPTTTDALHEAGFRHLHQAENPDLSLLLLDLARTLKD